ncbi:MAG: hypothetical protein JWO82_483 [Akkermansiaceae bacterium]|nr:hypothetical protein [Akkermansiaceae bacterium]
MDKLIRHHLRISRPSLASSGCLVALSLCLSLTSCDKAKKLLNIKPPEPEAKVVGTTPGGEPDTSLASQVSRNETGVCFRKDLPFPTTVSVKVEELVKWSAGHKISKSALGMENATFDGDYQQDVQWDLAKGLATIQISATGPVIVKEEDKPLADKTPPKPLVPLDELARYLGKPLTLRQSSGSWAYAPAGKEKDFQEMVWAKGLAPTANSLFADAGLLPRSRWFSSTRYWKAGDSVELTGESLQLLFPGKPSGAMTLTFEDTEPVGGHPAGRFSIKGKVDIAALPVLDGDTVTATIAISSGKIWCSLLHPVVLREEYEAVEMLARGTADGPNLKIQGTAQVQRSRTWKED